jgi:adenylate kinase family enzyme
MGTQRIHITGASGAGVTTLGRSLANALAAPHHDTDDYFWLPTTPPFREKRDAADRLRLMRQLFLPRAEWVLTGSLQGWGDPLISYFDMVVFLYTPKEVRLKRLRDRETARFGAEAVAPGGWRHDETERFIEWASQYDDGEQASRTLERHQAWLAALPCRVLRLDGSGPLPELVGQVIAALRDQEASRACSAATSSTSDAFDLSCSPWC